MAGVGHAPTSPESKLRKIIIIGVGNSLYVKHLNKKLHFFVASNWIFI